MSFYLIFDRAQIHKRYRWFNPAQVKFYSFVADGFLSLPELDQLLAATSPNEKRAAVRSMAANVLNQWEGVQVTDRESDHIFRFGDTGRILYRNPKIPESIDWIMLVIDNEQDVRDLGARIEQLLPDAQVDSLAGAIITLAGVSGSPQAAAAIVVSKMLVKVITVALKGDANDQLGVIEQSFIRDLHYPDGKRTGAGVEDLGGNMWYDYTVFGTNDV